jgi:PPE-repeat protein
MSMTSAAGTYVEWLSATAAQAEQTAAQARAAAAGYEAAFAMTVPPPEIAANRSLLAVLVATNFLGQNTPAIAATEALYAAMWAQDAVAMYGYAGSSAAATVLTPFASPHQNTDPGGTPSQAATVGQAASTAAGNAQSTISTVPQALSAAAAPAQSDPLTTLANVISVFFSAPTDLATLFLLIPMDALGGPVDLPIAYLGTVAGQNTDDIISGWEGTEAWPGSGPAALEPFPATLTNPPAGGLPVPTMSAGMGQANMIGGLSVPSNWTVAAPEIRSVALESPLTTPAAAAAPLEAGSASSFNQMGLAGMAGQAMAGPPATDDSQQSGKPVTHARLQARGQGAAGDDESEVLPAPRTVVTGVAAAIREITKLRNAGRLTEEEYKEQKKRLLEVSIRHRPLA